MQNPILTMLNGNRNNQQNNMIQKLLSIKSFLQGKNSNDLYKQMLNSNPQFREFVKRAEGKTLEDLAMEYDLDLNLLKQFL